jgi:hypothetical protein
METPLSLLSFRPSVITSGEISHLEQTNEIPRFRCAALGMTRVRERILPFCRFDRSPAFWYRGTSGEISHL